MISRFFSFQGVHIPISIIFSESIRVSVVYVPETSWYPRVQDNLRIVAHIPRSLEEEVTDHLQVSGVETGTMEYGFHYS